MTQKEIRVCEECGTPLIWTFRWDYKERYCLNCGALGDMFLGKNVELTKELKLKERIVNRIWKSLYGKTGDLLPISSGYQKSNCKKCQIEKSHSLHLSKREIRNNKVAEKILNKMIGIFPLNNSL